MDIPRWNWWAFSGYISDSPDDSEGSSCLEEIGQRPTQEVTSSSELSFIFL